MKAIVIYSSRTGNTKLVAEAMASALPAGTPCVSVKEVPADLASYDVVFMVMLIKLHKRYLKKSQMRK